MEPFQAPRIWVDVLVTAFFEDTPVVDLRLRWLRTTTALILHSSGSCVKSEQPAMRPNLEPTKMDPKRKNQ